MIISFCPYFTIQELVVILIPNTAIVIIYIVLLRGSLLKRQLLRILVEPLYGELIRNPGVLDGSNTEHGRTVSIVLLDRVSLSDSYFLVVVLECDVCNIAIGCQEFDKRNFSGFYLFVEIFVRDARLVQGARIQPSKLPSLVIEGETIESGDLVALSGLWCLLRHRRRRDTKGCDRSANRNDRLHEVTTAIAVVFVRCGQTLDDEGGR